MPYFKVAQILCFILFSSDGFKKRKKDSKWKPEKSSYLVFMLYSTWKYSF